MKKIFFLVFFAILFFILDLVIGPMSFKELFANSSFAFLDIRLSRALTALFAGASIAISGLLLQSYFKNPLADPYILGINSGASLGVAFILLLSNNYALTIFLSTISTTIAASVGSLAVTFLIILISTKMKNNYDILIIGIFISFAVNAIVSILLYFALPQQVDKFLSWNFGSFARVSFNSSMIIIFTFIVVFIWTLMISKKLNIMLLGDDNAKVMGINIKVLNLEVLFLSAVPVAVVTSLCGPIAFIGIAAPRIIIDFFKIEDRKILIPLSALSGSVLALFADIITKAPFFNFTLPLNAILSIIGFPVVILFLLRGESR